MKAIATALIVSLVVSLALTACGRRGNLERPPSGIQEYPRVYPDPQDK
jgi:predicted small lipoprotein YifL